jgi:multidrug transporter EmrE-like cation transporter
MDTIRHHISSSDHARFSVLSLLAMVLLAGLDIAGALAAKEWMEHRHPLYFIGGLLTFGLLFAVYAKSLSIAELPIVTLGWIVCLQIGLTIIDRIFYDSDLPAGKLIAILVIVVLQGYIMLAPNDGRF